MPCPLARAALRSLPPSATPWSTFQISLLGEQFGGFRVSLTAPRLWTRSLVCPTALSRAPLRQFHQEGEVQHKHTQICYTLTTPSPPKPSENHQPQLSCWGSKFQPTKDPHWTVWMSNKGRQNPPQGFFFCLHSGFSNLQQRSLLAQPVTSARGRLGPKGSQSFLTQAQPKPPAKPGSSSTAPG